MTRAKARARSPAEWTRAQPHELCAWPGASRASPCRGRVFSVQSVGRVEAGHLACLKRSQAGQQLLYPITTRKSPSLCPCLPEASYRAPRAHVKVTTELVKATKALACLPGQSHSVS